MGSLSSDDSVYWMVPLMCVNIVIAVSLDYDVLLLVRIREFRYAGFTTVDSIRLGAAAAGRVITAAGIIMAISFSGLLMSREKVMDTLAFYLTFAVLFDTAVVRTLLVPAALSLFGEANWWPCKPPPVQRDKLQDVSQLKREPEVTPTFFAA